MYLVKDEDEDDIYNIAICDSDECIKSLLKPDEIYLLHKNKNKYVDDNTTELDDMVKIFEKVNIDDDDLKVKRKGDDQDPRSKRKKNRHEYEDEDEDEDDY